MATRDTDYGNRKPPAVLIIGGGVGGMRAAIDIAEAGLQVYLIEQTHSLGGRVAQLGFMFPTHDCVLCRGTSDHGYGCTRPSITPALMDTNLHPNITLMMGTTVTAFEGQAGNFLATVHHEPRYVDIERCINCGYCTQVCPAELPSAFQQGLATRKAAYKPAPRVIPDAYIVDKGPYCEDCGECVKVCPTGAIDLNVQPYDEMINVGAVILAVGYDIFDPTPYEEFGFRRYPNVLHSMQYERLASRSGPTEGFVLRPSDGKAPKKIAWLQCIGSRDQKYPFCSSICCMYATKEAMLALQRGTEDTEATIFVMDERAFNKEYNRYYVNARDKYGVKYIRCRPSEIREDPETGDLLLQYLNPQGELLVEPYDLVVLVVGTQPPSGADHLAEVLDIELNEYGFCETDKFSPLQTSRPGVFVCGAFAAPKEIGETMIDASGAAAEVMRMLSEHLGRFESSRAEPFYAKATVRPAEIDITSQPPRVGVFVCSCGPDISRTIDVQTVSRYAETLPDVVYSNVMDFACFPEGLARIKNAIQSYQLNRVVVAGCSNRTHEPLFQRMMRQVRLNAYLLELVNIREHCAWVHQEQPEAATRKAKELVRMAVGRVPHRNPIRKEKLKPVPTALVIGGGVSGMTAALAIADAGYNVHIVERGPTLGGHLRRLYFVAEGPNPQRLLRDTVNRVRSHEHIFIHTLSEVVRHTGHAGDFRSVIRPLQADAEDFVLSHAVTIVATGGEEARDGSAYLMGRHPSVVAASDLEEMIIHEPERIAKLKQVVLIQCVRPEGAPEYCSRTCCTNTMKNASRIRMLNPNCQVVVLYKDIVTYGFRERYYTEARQAGSVFIRYSDDNKPVVEDVDGELRVTITDPALGREVILEPDLIGLSMSTSPAERTEALAKTLGVPLSLEGFFLEAHLKMRPMDFMEEGIFLAGMAHYPKFIEECMSNALATAGRALTFLSKRVLDIGGVVAEIDPAKCVGCLTCVRTCPFGIPQVRPDLTGVGEIVGAAWIDPARCQGCGTCTAECPARAIQLIRYEDEVITMHDSGGLGKWLPETEPVEIS